MWRGGKGWKGAREGGGWAGGVGGGLEEGWGGGYLFVAFLSHLAADHTPLSRGSTVPIPTRTMSNVYGTPYRPPLPQTNSKMVRGDAPTRPSSNHSPEPGYQRMLGHTSLGSTLVGTT